MHVLSVLAASNNSNPLGFLLPLVIIGGAMYFLMIRPQRRKMRAQAELQSSIEIGDEVMTTSGIYGFVTSFDGDIAWLEIDDDVQIRIARAALTRKVDTAAAPGQVVLPGDKESGKAEPSDGESADEPSK